MAIFEDVTVMWKGEEHTIESNRVFPLIAKLEDNPQYFGTDSDPIVYKGTALKDFSDDRRSNTQIALAYKIILSHAGVDAHYDETYAALFGKGGKNVSDVLLQLMQLMVPPSTYKPTVKTEAKTEPQSESD